MGRECSTNGEKRNAYRVLAGKPEGRTPLDDLEEGGRDNIKMEVRYIGRSVMDWIDLAQDRDQWKALGKTIMNLGVQ
jgi:hypothetical protein